MSDPARITPYRDGPLLVRGPFTLTDQDGATIETHQGTIALCRCGRSQRKPFCDGTHNAINFHARERTAGVQVPGLNTTLNVPSSLVWNRW